MRYPRNSYAAKEMRRRRIEARSRLKRRVFDLIAGVTLMACAEVLFFAIFLFL